ncbi:hypothetical protein C9J44_07980 [Photobacterium sp. GB-27]|nr:hypothetical protein C9J42_07540 [Photobacterium sp. GB-56]PSV37153.1 hypothetical protein C9J44_07980 [Photobacterium sp. GB-27]PSV57173.1 hypothetical protein C9J43_08325 [Photobacterium sp. GB-3]
MSTFLGIWITIINVVRSRFREVDTLNINANIRIIPDKDISQMIMTYVKGTYHTGIFNWPMVS